MIAQIRTAPRTARSQGCAIREYVCRGESDPVQAGLVASGIFTALRRQPTLAPGMGARAQASGKRGARLLDGD